jgi:hypothetical protein
MIAAMRRGWPVVLLLALFPCPVHAQTVFEVSGGYSLAHDPRDAVTLPAGWFAGAAIRLTSALSAVADVSGQYATIPLFESDARVTAHGVLGGLRLSARLGRITEFGQVLAGVVRTSGSAFGSTTSGQSLGVQPGAGIDYPLARTWSARAELDIRLIASQPDATNGGHQYRFVAALVYANPRHACP